MTTPRSPRTRPSSVVLSFAHTSGQRALSPSIRPFAAATAPSSRSPPESPTCGGADQERLMRRRRRPRPQPLLLLKATIGGMAPPARTPRSPSPWTTVRTATKTAAREEWRICSGASL